MSLQTNLIRLVINSDGKLIDKVNSFIVANSQYASHIQVIAPFPSTDSVTVNYYLRNARTTTYSQYMKLLRGEHNKPILARNVIDSSSHYYQLVKDWYVWQIPISAKALRAISKYHAGKVDVSISFKEFKNYSISDTMNEKGTFGSNKSTTRGDLPIDVEEGDYYKCDHLDYYSYVADLEFTLLDLAIYSEGRWIKGSVYGEEFMSPTTELGVDPSVFNSTFDDIDISTSERLMSRLSDLENIIVGEFDEDDLSRMYVRNTLDINYDNVDDNNGGDVLYIERNEEGKSITKDDFLSDVNDLNAKKIRTTEALSANKGKGFYADNESVLIGSATGPGLTWNGRDNSLKIRGTLEAAEITDPDLLEQIRGPQGPEGPQGPQGDQGEQGPIGPKGNDGTSFNFKGILTYLSDLSFISNPKINDGYRIIETGEIWVWNGVEWVNMGSIKGETGDPAKYVIITGEQAFKYPKGEIKPTNDYITLTANLYGGLTTYTWQYLNEDNTWVDFNDGNYGETYSIVYNDDEWFKDSIRIRCVSGDYSDEITLVKLYDGRDGVDGQHSLNGYLTNENMSITTNYNGMGYNLSQAFGIFDVYYGSTLVNQDVEYSLSSDSTIIEKTQNGLTLTIDENGNYSLSGIDNSWTSDYELFTIYATYNGNTIHKDFTINKSKQGQDATSDYVKINGKTIFKYLEGEYTPSYTYIDLEATVYGDFYSYKWQYNDNDTWIDLSGINNQKTYRLYYYNSAWGDNDTLQIRCINNIWYDTVTISKLYDGSNSLTLNITNENVSIPSNYDGSGYSLYDAGSTIRLYDGIDTVDPDNIYVESHGLVEVEKNGLIIHVNNKSLYFTETSRDSWSTDIEHFLISVFYNGRMLTRKITISKAKSGKDGVSDYVKVNGKNVFKYPLGATEPIDTSITLEAVVYGELESYNWEWNNNGVWDDLSGDNSSQTYIVSHDAIEWGDNSTLQVRCRNKEWFDSFTLIKIYDGPKGQDGNDGRDGLPGEDGIDGVDGVDGQNSINGYLTNQNVTLPTNNDGSGYDLTKASGVFYVYDGLEEVTTLSEFNVTNNNLNGLSLNINSNGEYSLSGDNWISDLETFELTATYNNITIKQNFTIGKSRKGADGKPTYIKITGSNVFKYDLDNSIPTPTSLTLTASLFGDINSCRWFVLDNYTGSWVDLDNTSQTQYIPHDYYYWGNKDELRFRCVSDDNYYDEFTVVKLHDGETTLTLLVDNENIHIPTDYNGNNYLFDGGNQLYYGQSSFYYGTDVLYSGVSWSLNRYNTVTSLYKDGLTIELAMGSDSGDYMITTYEGSWNRDKTTFEIFATYKGVTISKEITLLKVKHGRNGVPTYVKVSGKNVFKYPNGSDVPTEEYINISAALYGDLSSYTWQYMNNEGTWIHFNDSSNTYSYNLTYNHQAWGNKSSLRVRCVSGLFSDEVTIIKVYDGDASLNGYLTNENISLPTKYDGTGYDITLADGTYNVYFGSRLVNQNTTYSIDTENAVNTLTKNGLTLKLDNISGNYYFEDDNWTSNVETFKLYATYNSITLVKVLTIGKVKDGRNAISEYVKINGENTFKYPYGSNEPTQLSITLEATVFGTLYEYKWQYLNSGQWIDFIDNDEKTLTINHDDESWNDEQKLVVRCINNEWYDTYTLVKLYDGSKGEDGRDALNGYLTNESVVIPTEYDGTEYDLSLVYGTFNVYYGTTLVNENCLYDVDDMISSTKNGLTLTIDNYGNYSLSGTNWTSDSESFHLEAEYEGILLAKVFTITKSKKGEQGPQGEQGEEGPEGPIGPEGQSKYVFITSTQMFKYSNNVVTPSSITMVAQLYGQLTNYQWKYYDIITNKWVNFTGVSNSNSYTLTPDALEWKATDGMVIQVRCISIDENGTEYFDEISIVKLFDGTNGQDGQDGQDGLPGEDGHDGDNGIPSFVGYLTNENVSIPTENDGTGYDLTKISSKFMMYEGIDPVNQLEESYFTFEQDTIVTSKTQNGLTLSIDTNGVITLSGTGWTTDFEEFEIYGFYNSPDYGLRSVVKDFSITKAKKGLDGQDGKDGENGQDGKDGLNGRDAKYVFITGEQTFKYPTGSSVPTSSQIELTVKFFGGTATFKWQYKDGLNWVNLPTPNTNNTYILSHDSYIWGNNQVLTIRCVATEDNIPYYDEITIVKLYDGNNGVDGQDGADGIDGENGVDGQSNVMGYLTNQNVSIPCNFDGTNYSLSNAGGSFKVFYGLSQVTSNVTYKVGTSTTQTKNGLTLSIDNTGAYSLTANNNSWTTSAEKFTLSATYEGVTITLDYTISKAFRGPVGDNGPGLVFQGDFKSTTTYRYDIIRRDVVKYNGFYYVLKDMSSFTGTWDSGKWEQLVNFNNIATDILLANNATITKGLVMGDNTDKGFIRSYGMSNLYSGEGFYLDGNGSVRLGSTTGNNLFWNGSTLSLKGDLTADNLTLSNDAIVTGSIVLGSSSKTANIRSYGASSLISGDGFFLSSDGKFRFGKAGGERVEYDGTKFSVVSSLIQVEIVRIEDTNRDWTLHYKITNHSNQGVRLYTNNLNLIDESTYRDNTYLYMTANSTYTRTFVGLKDGVSYMFWWQIYDSSNNLISQTQRERIDVPVRTVVKPVASDIQSNQGGGFMVLKTSSLPVKGDLDGKLVEFYGQIIMNGGVKNVKVYTPISFAMDTINATIIRSNSTGSGGDFIYAYTGAVDHIVFQHDYSPGGDAMNPVQLYFHAIGTSSFVGGGV